MKIYFIEAENKPASPPTSDWFDVSTKRFFCPSLALPDIAALTPKDIEIKIIDEKVERLDHDDLPDVAAISFKTMSSRRAYELADDFRKRGAKVILGGIHTSLMPDEAGKHCDSVVIGEGEEIWPSVIADLRSNKLKSVYQANKLIDISRAEPPRLDLLQNDKYACHSIQSSRGCSLNCDFCPTKEMFGGIFRTKPVKKVMEEIEMALSLERKSFFFNDDIFAAGDEGFALELLNKIKQLKIEFHVTSDFLVLSKKLLIALARSGCRYMALNMPGSCSPREVEAVKMIQRLGIEVWGYFMFGFKFHKKDVFDKVCDFVNKTGIKNLSLTVMAPYPNTTAGRKLAEEKRILSRDWTLYDQAHIIYKPDNMSVEELKEGFGRVKEEIGHLLELDLEKRRPLWKRCANRCFAEIASVLPGKDEKGHG